MPEISVNTRDVVEQFSYSVLINVKSGGNFTVSHTKYRCIC